ncbi:Hypothetical protein CAP_2074 [Chondromyces apiculatus DSM 436]|uniref:MipA/OmpV family protein n=1 Tax=Chondromyces apiculatus DSM 436 TaxID=1192034 RepID=A0A017TC60_9BACT|nr:Hypothetical protein CAP_2074 [Chondromyces apiculatus DSM 436]
MLSVALTAVAPVLLTASEARADWDPIMHRSDAGVDLYIWSARGIGTALPAVPFVQWDVAHNLFLGLRFPLATSFDPAYIGLGNPTASLWYSDIKGDLTWYAGGRVSLPLGLVDARGWRYATAAGAAAMGFWDPFLWANDSLPFGGYGGIEYRFADFFVLRAGGDLGFYPSLSRGRNFGVVRSGDLDVALQLKVEPEFQSKAGFGGGASLMTWVIPTASGDIAQTLIMPYFAYDSQKTFFMRAGALLALDRPLGPGFDRGGVASIYLQFGGHID